VGGAKCVDQLNNAGSECAKAAGREAKERGRCLGIEGLQCVAKRHEEQAERHAKAEAKETRSQEVSHARSLRWYALVDDVTWHERNDGVAADADVAFPSPRTERPLAHLQHELCLPISTFTSDFLVSENSSVRRGFMPECAYLRFSGGI
jgi:hypothetical protein